jgi:hypothetical protein
VTQMLKEVLTDSPDPADGVRAFVEAVAHVLRDSGYVFGCPVALIVLDSPESSALARSAGGKLREEGTSSLPESCSALRFWYGSLRLFVDVFREYDSYWLGVGRGQYFTSPWRSQAFGSSSERTFWPVITRPCDPRVSISERAILAVGERVPSGQRWHFSRS